MPSVDRSSGLGGHFVNVRNLADGAGDNGMHKSRPGICLWAVVSVFCCGLAHASSSTATPEDEYKKLIRVSEDIQPLGEPPYWENISLHDGALSFQQTEVSSTGSASSIRGESAGQDGHSVGMEIFQAAVAA